MVLALDWQKAFDAVDPGALLAALKRFGLPAHVVLAVIQSIYSGRVFQVSDCGSLSSQRDQNSGISQGCPLSPFLFVMLMTVLMRDAASALPLVDRQRLEKGDLTELLYADDTLLLSGCADSLEHFLAAVSQEGSKYGLSLHWGKLQLLKVRADEPLRRPDGSDIQCGAELLYLGSVISQDGRAGRELSRRIGIAQSEFRSLSRMWRHSALGRARKLELFRSLVLSKLLYGLAAIWPNVAERRKLDGFQNRCLRSIWGIKVAYISRVSNAQVLQRTGQQRLSAELERQQLLLYGKVARLRNNDLMREVALCPGTLRPATDRYVRKVGRPRLDWTTEVGKLALHAAGSVSSLEASIAVESSWKNLVGDFINSR